MRERMRGGANHIILIALLLVGLTVTVQPARAQEGSVRVDGIVVDAETDEPIPAVALLLEGDVPRLRRGTYSDGTGQFRFESVPRGSYRLVISRLGFASDTLRVDLAERPSEPLHIYLTPDEISSHEVTVTASRVQHDLGTAAISETTLRALPALGGESDPLRALQLLPGVASGTDMASGLYIRGGSPDQNLFLLDGMPLYNPSHLGGFMSAFNADVIEDVRLRKGIYPAEFGGRISSVVEVESSTGIGDSITGSVGLSLINARGNLQGPIGSSGRFMVSARRLYLDLLKGAAPDEEEIPGYHFYDVQGAVEWYAGNSDHFRATLFYNRDVLTNPADARESYQVAWGNQAAAVGWTHVFDDDFHARIDLNHTDYSFRSSLQGSAEDELYFTTSSGVRDYGVRLAAVLSSIDRHELKAGGEIIWHDFRAASAITSTMEDSPETDDQPNAANELAFFAQDRWSLSEKLEVEVGLRGTWFTAGDWSSMEPRLSLEYRPSDPWRFSAGYGEVDQNVHLVSRSDVTLPTDIWFPSSRNIPPSRSRQTTAGAAWESGDREWRVSTEGFHRELRDLLEYRDNVPYTFSRIPDTSLARGEGTATGVEILLEKRAGRLTGWIGYTLSWSEHHFPQLNGGRPFSPRFDQRHDVSVVAIWDPTPEWQFSATWIYASGQAYTVPSGYYFMEDPSGQGGSDTRFHYSERNGYRLPAYHKLDLAAARTFQLLGLEWRAHVSLYNLYARRNVFAQYLTKAFTWNPETGESDERFYLERITLFPFVPSLGLSVDF